MYGERRPEFDPDQAIKSLQNGIARLRGLLPGGIISVLIVVFGVLMLGWLATGIYTVGPTEQSVTRLFGSYSGTHGPGLHWYYPAPIGKRDIEAVLETKTMELGFRGQRSVPVESEMITGDLNIVDVQMVVQYRITSPEKFLFNIDDPGDPDRDERTGRPDGRTLKDATEAALRQVVGQRSIDDPLFVNKEAVQADTKLELQKILDQYQTGITILQVVLQTVRPPDAVRDAFDDVVRARVDKESRINESLSYEQDRVPRAKGQAQQVVQSAEAFKASRIARAQGEALEFSAVLHEYQKSKEVTRQRLYLEAMEDILPFITIFLVDGESGGNLLPFLPLTPGSIGSGVAN